MQAKDIRTMLTQLETVEFTSTDAYWTVKAQLVTALVIAQFNEQLLDALPNAGRGL